MHLNLLPYYMHLIISVYYTAHHMVLCFVWHKSVIKCLTRQCLVFALKFLYAYLGRNTVAVIRKTLFSGGGGFPKNLLHTLAVRTI